MVRPGFICDICSFAKPSREEVEAHEKIPIEREELTIGGVYRRIQDGFIRIIIPHIQYPISHKHIRVYESLEYLLKGSRDLIYLSHIHTIDPNEAKKLKELDPQRYELILDLLTQVVDHSNDPHPHRRIADVLGGKSVYSELDYARGYAGNPALQFSRGVLLR